MGHLGPLNVIKYHAWEVHTISQTEVIVIW